MADDWFAQNAPGGGSGDWFNDNAPVRTAPARTAMARSAPDYTAATTPPPPPQGSPTKRFFSSLGSSLGFPDQASLPTPPTSFGDAAKQAVTAGIMNQPPVAAAKMLGNAASGAWDSIKKSYNAFKSGSPVEGAGYAGAAVLPVVGPMAAKAGEQIGSGDIAGGIGTGLGTVANFAAGDALAPAMKGMAKELPSTVSRTATAVRDAAFPIDPVKTFAQAARPRASAIGFDQALQRAMPEMKASESAMGQPIQNVDQALQAIDVGKKRVRAQYDQAAGPMRAMGSTVDLSPVADAMEATVNKKMELENPSQAAAIRQQAAKYRQAVPLSDAEEMLKTTNAELDSYYAKFPTARRTALLGNPDTALLNAQGQALRNSIYSTIDNDGQGAAPREINRRYGALLQVEEELQRQKNRAMGEAPESLSEQVGRWAGYADIAKGAIKAGAAAKNPALAASALGDLASGVAKRGVSKWLKEQQTTNALIERAFRQYKGTPAPVEIPPTVQPKGLLPSAPVITPPPADATRVNITTGAPLQTPPSRLLPKGSIITPPPADTSGVNVTTSAPLRAPLNRQLPPASKQMPPPPDTSGPLPQPPPFAGHGMGERSLPPPSRVQTPGFAVADDLVPVTNPTTGKIEYIPKWMQQRPAKFQLSTTQKALTPPALAATAPPAATVPPAPPQSPVRQSLPTSSITPTPTPTPTPARAPTPTLPPVSLNSLADNVYSAYQNSSRQFPGTSVTFYRLKQENPALASVPIDQFDAAVQKLADERKIHLLKSEWNQPRPGFSRQDAMIDKNGQWNISMAGL